MLKELYLDHFVLAEKGHITFEKGFHVISGETGSGKTMITEALELALGQKGDPSYIQEGQDKSTIRALFEIHRESIIYQLLDESGITIEPAEELLIVRELHREQKNRIFIQSQISSLSVLKKISPYLIETLSQNSSLSLKEEQTQRELLDEYGETFSLKKEYEILFYKEKELQKELLSYEKEEKESTYLLPFWKEQVEEIKRAELKPFEEKELFESFKKLHDLKEGKELLKELVMTFSEGPDSLEEKIIKSKKLFLKGTKLFSELNFYEKPLEKALEAIKEIGYALSSKLSEGEECEQEILYIEKRLSLIKQLTKKYGPSLDDVLSHQKELEEKIKHSSSLSERIEQIRLDLKKTQENLIYLSNQLSTKRKIAAASFSEKVTNSLKQLNMSGALFFIRVEEGISSFHGKDKIIFELSSSAYGKSLPIKDHASGGELSRLFFAITLGLSIHNEEKTLIFDELDANMGGITASLFGKHLKDLGKHRQIICITHFPQVASFADHHIYIEKQEKSGKMIAQIKKLEEEEKKAELLRMLGGKPLFNSH